MADKITLATLRQAKSAQHPISMLTCYDYAMAVLLQNAGVDSLLVGDSLAQVVLGHPSTLAADMDLMIALTAAVRRGAPDVYLVGDMPFLSYQTSLPDAIHNAGRFLREAQCDAVKIEVDHRWLDLVENLSRAGIPIIAHLGYRPQWAGQRPRIVETRGANEARDLVADAQAMEHAGAAALLLECVTAHAARAVRDRVSIPVIGCGSGPWCDGQVLVLHELLDLPGARHPRFAKTYAQLADPIRQAAAAYAQDVREGRYPDLDHSYLMKDDERARFEASLKNAPTPNEP